MPPPCERGALQSWRQTPQGGRLPQSRSRHPAGHLALCPAQAAWRPAPPRPPARLSGPVRRPPAYLRQAGRFSHSGPGPLIQGGARTGSAHRKPPGSAVEGTQGAKGDGQVGLGTGTALLSGASGRQPTLSCEGLSGQELPLREASAGRRRLSAGRRHVSAMRRHVSAGRHHMSAVRRYVSAGRHHVSAVRRHVSAVRPHVSAGRHHVSAVRSRVSAERPTGRCYVSTGDILAVRRPQL